MLAPPVKLPAIPSVMVSSTSTLLPGRMKPATPDASVVVIVKARIPFGISAAIPRPAPLVASLFSRIASSRISGIATVRSIASSIFMIAPGDTSSLGKSRVLSSSLVIVPPRAMSAAATTTGTISPFGGDLISELTPTAAVPPKNSASIATISVRGLISLLPMGWIAEEDNVEISLTGPGLSPAGDRAARGQGIGLLPDHSSVLTIPTSTMAAKGMIRRRRSARRTSFSTRSSAPK